MEELEKLKEIINKEKIVNGILSKSVNPQNGQKLKIRTVLIKGERVCQFELFKGTQVFHENVKEEDAAKRVISYLSDLFMQGEIKTKDSEINVLISKKGRITLKVKKQKETQADNEALLTHNKEKHYILPEGEPVDFLVGLNVMTPDGKITKNRYDKFRQINRYLEFIEDCLDSLPKDRTIRIIDFGCGKSYLTFAMYYFLGIENGRDIEVTGLDLKKDVIRDCNELAKTLQYDKLHFEVGDIKNYSGTDKVDMVVSLHACDTATDYALEKAIKWGARVILAVPCCQHEINRQIKSEELKPVLKYGLIKERISALFTDAIRANLLEEAGYETQILEFIDMEHTPKNILIRAVKKNKMTPVSRKTDIEQVISDFNLNPTLQNLLRK